MRGAWGATRLVLVLVVSLSCGDDDARPASEDAGTGDAGGPERDATTDAEADAGPVNTCLAPELQHPPCCWESSNADRDVIQLAARGAAFDRPMSFMNEVFRATIQEGLDAADGGEPNFMLLVRLTPDGDGYRTEVGFGCRSSREEPFRFGRNGSCGATDDRWEPIVAPGRIEDELLSTETANVPLVVPLPAAGSPPPDLVFHAPRIVRARLTDGRTCVGSRTVNRRWSYGERGDESAVEGFLRVDEARAITLMSEDGLSFCDLVARTACDRPRAEWEVKPDSRCDGGVCVPDACPPESDDEVTGCNAWRISLRFAAAGVDIEE